MKGRTFEICGQVKKAELIVLGQIPCIRFRLTRLDGVELVGLARKGFGNLTTGRTVTVRGSYTWQMAKYGREYILMCDDVLPRRSLQALRRAG